METEKQTNKGKTYKKKPNLNSKIGKYYKAVQQGKTKKEAQAIAGFADSQHVTRIEDTKTYKAIEEKFYAQELSDIITLKEIAFEQVKVIKQDKDLGSKNAAIKQALDKIEPDDKPVETEKVIVVLR